MNSNTSAIAALILVPIAIAASAAFLAIKTAHLCRSASRALKHWFSAAKPSQKRHSLRRSNLSSTQTYADSWVDLESVADNETRIDTFINQTPVRANSGSSSSAQCPDTAGRVWHPNRDARLTWSFANPSSPHHFASSNVAKPSPVAHLPERLSTEDVEFLLAPTRVEEVHQ